MPKRVSRMNPVGARPAVMPARLRTATAVLPVRCLLSSATAADVKPRFLSSPVETVPCTAATASKHSVRTGSDLHKKEGCLMAVLFLSAQTVYKRLNPIKFLFRIIFVNSPGKEISFQLRFST